MRVVTCQTASEIAALPPTPSLPNFKPSEFEAHHADLHLCALAGTGDIQARCSLWWKESPSYEHHCVGIVGHYAASNDEAAAVVLAEANACLNRAGCTYAIGPMNGNTWRSYRFVTESGEEPAFFLEPSNPPEWSAHFVTAEFSPLASYLSALNSNLSEADPRMDSVQKRMTGECVIIRAADGDLKRELPAIYEVSRIAFKHNFLYTEIPWPDFAAMYEPVLPIARSELVFIAERSGHCVGYLFAVPDFAQSARGLPIDTFIIKTVAILPEPELRGLGTLLVAHAQQQGCKLGYRRCIHALMFENNISLNISRHYASPIRKYTLYGKELSK